MQVFVYKSLTIPGASLPSVINHYTVYYGDEQEEIALSLDEALGLFYHSEVYQLMRDGVSDMHCMSDAYLAEELEQEYQTKK